MPISPDARKGDSQGIRLLAEDEVNDLRDVERLAAADSTLHDAALRRLYSRHAADLTRLVHRLVSSESDSTDVVQEIFILVWQQANRYDPHRGTVGAWLAMMARSRATDVRRARHASKRRPVIDATQPTNVAAVEAGTDYAMLHAGITLLPESQRQLVDLAYFEGLSHSQIARATSLPVGTVKTRLRIAVQNLRLAVPHRTVDVMMAFRARLPIFKWLEPRLIPDLADLYFVDLVDQLGHLQRTEWGHADAGRQGQLDAIWRFVPPTDYARHPIRRVLQSGRPEFVSNADGVWQRSVAMSDQHLHFMESTQLRSLICHPLQLNGRFLGSLTVARVALSGRTYRYGDVESTGALANVIAANLKR